MLNRLTATQTNDTIQYDLAWDLNPHPPLPITAEAVFHLDQRDG